jgi:hypothetical protein
MARGTSKRGKFLPYVAVEWKDAHQSARTAWRPLGEAEDYHDLPCICSSVGFLVKRDKKGLTLAMSMSDEGLLCGLWHIPAGMVRSVRRLRAKGGRS